MEQEPIIIKELEIMQGIIARQEEMRMQCRNWYITIVTALTVAFFSKEVSLGQRHYLLITLVLAASFLWLEVIHRVAEQRAMDRGLLIEQALRKEVVYNGPSIGESFKDASTKGEQLKALNNIRLYATYLLLSLLAIIVSFLK